MRPARALAAEVACALTQARRGRAGSDGQLPGLHLELSTPVLGPAGLGVLRADRVPLAVGGGRDTVGLDPLGDQVAPDGVRAPLTELQVVVVRAALVGVAADEDRHVPARLEPAGIVLEEPGVARADLRLVKVEMDIPQLGDSGELARRCTGGCRGPGRLSWPRLAYPSRGPPIATSQADRHHQCR